MSNRSASLSVTILPETQLANSSTGQLEILPFTRARKTFGRRFKMRVSEEVCLSPMTCETGSDSRHVSRPVDGLGERKEANSEARFIRCKSNRKERFESAFEALLIRPNTSGIGTFEVQQRQQSAAAFELVMDRSAECAAGGCDAV